MQISSYSYCGEKNNSEELVPKTIHMVVGFKITFRCKSRFYYNHLIATFIIVNADFLLHRCGVKTIVTPMS
ncbi:hypothetical protein AQUCO_00500350v1 [Aquilegia coerulea]|uniref:Uncharacterized protein n=1 Tax=Aquilegia coerulea TaxID=218851 RepID=A0A2G5ERI6_AQUCA|nr:hypothetical protein AQUCO_00500350v1 [Aquilegia coerulea]